LHGQIHIAQLEQLLVLPGNRRVSAPLLVGQKDKITRRHGLLGFDKAKAGLWPRVVQTELGAIVSKTWGSIV
jgi:hypothetical protein